MGAVRSGFGFFCRGRVGPARRAEMIMMEGEANCCWRGGSSVRGGGPRRQGFFDIGETSLHAGDQLIGRPTAASDHGCSAGDRIGTDAVPFIKRSSI